jgi:hypothetical protein
LTSDHYFNLSPLLGWTVVIIAARRHSNDEQLLDKLRKPYHKLLWNTISEMPQKHHVVKALILLCTWPVPLVMELANHGTGNQNTASNNLGLSERDPTFMYSGITFQIELQTGLHRAHYAQDFLSRPDMFRKLRLRIGNCLGQFVILFLRDTSKILDKLRFSVFLTSGQPFRKYMTEVLDPELEREPGIQACLRLNIV